VSTTSWQTQIAFDEDDKHTHATVVVRFGDETEVRARGDAYRNPRDPSQPMVGEEIAAARAFSELASRLLERAAGQIQAATHEQPHLTV
jgi:hypothetical protein